MPSIFELDGITRGKIAGGLRGALIDAELDTGLSSSCASLAIVVAMQNPNEVPESWKTTVHETYDAVGYELNDSDTRAIDIALGIAQSVLKPGDPV